MWAIINILQERKYRKKRNFLFREIARIIPSLHVSQTEKSIIIEARDIVEISKRAKTQSFSKAYNLTRPARKPRRSTLRKNIILHLAKHTQFITLQTRTSVRETSTLKHGSKYWKLLETLETFLLCFLNAGFYFASLSSIFVLWAKLEYRRNIALERRNYLWEKEKGWERDIYRLMLNFANKDQDNSMNWYDNVILFKFLHYHFKILIKLNHLLITLLSFLRLTSTEFTLKIRFYLHLKFEKLKKYIKYNATN